MFNVSPFFNFNLIFNKREGERERERERGRERKREGEGVTNNGE